jgi:beta-lactamase regulating signal transducer with metallopeptidase domain
MSFTTLLSAYLTLNVLLVVAFTLLAILRFALVWRPRHFAGERARVSARAEHRAHVLALTAVLVLTFASVIIRPTPVFQPVMKVWSASSIKAFSHREGEATPRAALALPSLRGEAMVHLDPVAVGLAAVFLAICLSLFWRLAVDLRKLRRLRRASYLVRSIGSVRLLVSDELDVPFSLWTLGRAEVYLPAPLLAKPECYRIAVLHELQHHRQGDTRWVYAMWALKALCLLNPVVPLWERWFSEIQEFACDETLVDQKRVESRPYARCLIEVAETALNQRRLPVCATGLVFLGERQLLKRRIETMISSAQEPKKRSIGKFAMALTVLTLAGTAWASKCLVQDRRVTMAEAQAMAKRAEVEAGMPIAMNELVLKQLNIFVGTPEGRAYMRKAFDRMEAYQPMLDAKVRQYQAPPALLAIPIVESGYENLEPHEGKPWGAGMWMFIASTARNFGIRVDESIDQRNQPELETDAAMRLLKSDHLRFNDWYLAILGYNAGEKAVQERINATGSRDPWQLLRSGLKTDPDYLAKVLAAIVILRNPEVLK